MEMKNRELTSGARELGEMALDAYILCILYEKIRVHPRPSTSCQQARKLEFGEG
jgi:hypothetical protein